MVKYRILRHEGRADLAKEIGEASLPTSPQIGWTLTIKLVGGHVTGTITKIHVSEGSNTIDVYLEVLPTSGIRLC
jgi:hypothetical protein